MSPPDYDALSPEDRATYVTEFQKHSGGKGRVSGAIARPIMERSGLNPDTLRKVWDLSDWDRDGALDEAQWVVAMHYCRVASLGGRIPDRVPVGMVPARIG